MAQGQAQVPSHGGPLPTGREEEELGFPFFSKYIFGVITNQWTRGSKLANDREKRRVSVIKETGEQCTVVFASIVTEPTIVGRGGCRANPHTHIHSL